jgi:hypothetical protein
VECTGEFICRDLHKLALLIDSHNKIKQFMEIKAND